MQRFHLNYLQWKRENTRVATDIVFPSFCMCEKASKEAANRCSDGSSSVMGKKLKSEEDLLLPAVWPCFKIIYKSYKNLRGTWAQSKEVIQIWPHKHCNQNGMQIVKEHPSKLMGLGSFVAFMYVHIQIEPTHQDSIYGHEKELSPISKIGTGCGSFCLHCSIRIGLEKTSCNAQD